MAAATNGCHGERKTAADISTSFSRNGNAKKRHALLGAFRTSGV